MIESVVIICDKSPIGSNSAIESFRLGAGFLGLGEEINSKVLLRGDAIRALLKNIDPTAVGMDSFEEPLEMAELSDLTIYIIEEDLAETGLTKDELIEYEFLNIITLDEASKLIETADTCFRF